MVTVDPGAFVDTERRRGRGAQSNASGRFERTERIDADDGWGSLGTLERFRTETQIEHVRSIISRNDSPDISFDQSINPYRGCEHGCIYCYARPGHAFLGHSPGLDFETKLYAKGNAADVLVGELSKRGYVAKTIALGAVTDPYQPIERTYELSRRILEVMEATSHPVGIVTKSHLVTRDIDILARLARRNLVRVGISVTTLDPRVARTMEPRAATPSRRLKAIERLAGAGIPVTVMAAPVIPGLNDHEIEAILARGAKGRSGKCSLCAAAAAAGTQDAVQGMAGREFSRPGESCDPAAPIHAWRAGLSRRVRSAAARHRPLRGLDHATLRQSDQAAWAQRAPR